MVDIKEMLSLKPENLAAQQHEALKQYVVQKIKDFNQLINSEKYEEALNLLANSPAGDGYGCDNEYLDFSETGSEDIGCILRKLKSLQHMSKKKVKSPVAKHVNTFNKPSVTPCKKSSLLRSTEAREAEESVAERLVEEGLELKFNEEEE